MKFLRSTSVLLVVFSILFTSCVKRKEPPMSEPAMEMEMVLLPAGEFLMGAEEKEGSDNPVHRVAVDSFYMDKYEVTNAQYFRFCQETGRDLPQFWGMKEFHSGLDYPNHPVVGVSWRDAEAYAEWIGKRLPTEAEWEYAARGGLVGKDFPNGDDLDSSTGNFSSKGTVPVGSYSPNGFGLHDMAGNVAEWVFDYYHEDYYRVSPQKNPGGPDKGKFRVTRGGGWHSGKICCSVSIRNGLIDRWVDFNLGFRCVKDLG
jgi:formylglycine-generating enzyme required for sulfatase activity